VRNPKRVEEGGHQRALRGQVIRDERARRDGLRHIRHLRQMTGAPIDGQRLHASHPKIQPPGKHADSFHLLHLGIVALFAPKRVGERNAAFERETFPEL